MALSPSLMKDQQSNSGESNYYKLAPEAILQDVERLSDRRIVNIKGLDMICCPHVYPSDQFRTTNFLLDAVSPFLKDARVCDMGCGPGVVGLYSIVQGAKKVVQADINYFAVQNAEENKKFHKISDEKMMIYHSDCFDNIPEQVFDVIIFNLPFHSDPVEIQDPLQHAFFDPSFQTVKKFLSQAEIFSIQDKTCIFLAFSNKGDVETLEQIFKNSTFSWSLWKVTNQQQLFDNRIYLLRKN